MTAPRSPGRRRFAAQLGALGAAALAPRASSAPGVAVPADWCGLPPGAPLLVPRDRGWLGRFAPRGAPMALATVGSATVDTPWPTAFAAEQGDRAFRNPTLAFERGERARIALANTLAEPTVVHWHGLAIDTANDGAGFTLVPPGGSVAYDFDVRARAGLYWYHPHPHGLTAAQAYRGLFGLMLVDDDEDRALRAALDVAWGRTDIPLVLQDRRAGAAYAPGAADLHHGFLGDVATVNGSATPKHAVTARPYRFRILNASNARTYLLGFADAAGRAIPFTLLGTDGGLLAAPVACRECFLSPAERVDVLLDLSRMEIGGAVVLETRAFDPMHFDPPGSAARSPAEVTPTHAMPAPRAGSAPLAGEPWPEGAARRLLTLEIRDKTAWRGALPARLSALAAPPLEGARDRAFRLGFAKGRWRINDRVYAPDEAQVEVGRGATETWLLRNYHTSMPHAMHLHGFQFRVLERETSPEQVAALAIDDRGRLATDLGAKDTVLVWPGESVRVAIDFRHPFPGAQTYLFHCHNLEHEDGAMMLRVRVG